MPDLPDLRKRTDQNRVDFLQTDLALCFTFADIAITELKMPDREAAERVLRKAEHGYASMLHFLADVEDGKQRQAIGQRLVSLRARLDDVTRQVFASPSL